ncbi:MAG TPA: serine hydrolase domain-containing protein [Ohtaekwangia sp.]
MNIKYYILAGVTLLVLSVFLLERSEKTVESKPAPLPAVAKTKTPVYVNPKFQHLLDDYEKEIEDLMRISGIPGAAIAIVKDSNIVFLKGFGVKIASGKDSVNENTVFRLASVSKCFSSFLTGMLVADDTLNWDDPVIKYVPSFALKTKEQTEQLTLRHVLSHTTGLPYHTYTTLVEDGTELSVMLAKLKDVDLSNKVGVEYSYQNVVYSVIGEVIHAATGKSFEEEMKERVFGPLNMTDASLDYNTITQNVNRAWPHRIRYGKWRPTSITNTYYNVAPAGGINASISDMANWMMALLGNRPDVIHPETLEQVFTPEVKAPSKNRNYGRTQRLSSSYYGLGWRILYYPNDTLVYHGGYVNGFRSEVAINTKERIAVCLLANAPGMVADKGIPIFFNLFRAQYDSIQAYDNRQRILLARTPAP